MGIANFKVYLGLDTITSRAGLKVRVLSDVVNNLPENTKLVGVENTDLCTIFKFENKVFKDDSEIEANYRRDIAIVDGRITDIDHFTGLDLEQCLLR